MFRKHLIDYRVFSLQEVEKLFPDFNRVNLVNWQKKGYIHKLRNGWYKFAEIPLSETILFLSANRIYSPSYISFESAAYWHGLIPEAVFTIKSATTLKTAEFKNRAGMFQYITLRNSLYFGYEWIEKDGLSIRMANVEKTLIDWFYIKSSINKISDIEGLRLNKAILKDKIDIRSLDNYKALVASTVVTKRISLLKQFIYD